ncbi:MAG: hypothetical protein HOV81_24360, partial [Kofleriaceae bacterium]|nr:hypothetical protein [Kofleriaceae bacterium]
MDWGERADWNHRRGELGELRYEDGEVVAPYYWKGSDRFAEAWDRLPPHPHLLRLRPGRMKMPGTSRLQYAAIDWQPRGPATAMMLAAWTIQVADVFRVIKREVVESDLALFGKPMIYIDIGGAARVGFAPSDSTTEPRDERSLAALVASR